MNVRKILFNLILRCIKSAASRSISRIIDKSTINHHFKASNCTTFKNLTEITNLNNY